MSSTPIQPRTLTDLETSVVTKLLSWGAAGATDYLAQVPYSQVVAAWGYRFTKRGSGSAARCGASIRFAGRDLRQWSGHRPQRITDRRGQSMGGERLARGNRVRLVYGRTPTRAARAWSDRASVERCVHETGPTTRISCRSIGSVTAAHNYSDLHALIDRLEPGQADEVRRHVLPLVRPETGRFSVLRTFDGPSTDLGASAKDVLQSEIGESDADRWHWPVYRLP